LFSSAFISLVVAENASGGGASTIEGQHVVAARRPIAEHEDLARAFGAQVDESVPRAAQDAGEIEVARLERRFAARHDPVVRLSSSHSIFSSKKGA
jgi:hypothetical protein